jgi:hypothetical protein
MPLLHLAALYRHYNAILNAIPSGTHFDSHEFIQQLAQAHQKEYITALNYYVRRPAPFKSLHRALSSRLRMHRQVVYIGRGLSPDIFGDVVSNARWRRR